MNLIFIYGLPATGKLTVAQELFRQTGYKVFHNHLVVNLLLSTFDFGSRPFMELREQMWLSVFDHACRAQTPALIFTFNPETTVSASFIPNTVELIGKYSGTIHFIELLCPLEELQRRIDNPSRSQHQKLTSLALFNRLYASGEFDTSRMPNPCLRIDTGRTPPSEAAQRIVDALRLDLAQDRYQARVGGRNSAKRSS